MHFLFNSFPFLLSLLATLMAKQFSPFRATHTCFTASSHSFAVAMQQHSSMAKIAQSFISWLCFSAYVLTLSSTATHFHPHHIMRGQQEKPTVQRNTAIKVLDHLNSIGVLKLCSASYGHTYTKHEHTRERITG